MKQRKGRTEMHKRKGLRPEKPVLSKTLTVEFVQFMEYHDANHFSQNLRKMLLEFLMKEEAIESVYVKDLLYDFDGLFDLLDAIRSETERAESG